MQKRKRVAGVTSSAYRNLSSKMEFFVSNCDTIPEFFGYTSLGSCCFSVTFQRLRRRLIVVWFDSNEPQTCEERNDMRWIRCS
jgi:hypothetical protein